MLISPNTIPLPEKKYYVHKSPPTPNQSICKSPPSILDPCLQWSCKICKICHHTTQNIPRTLQNGLYFVNIYRNITDINFPPVTYVYTVQMQQKKKIKIKIPSSVLRLLSQRTRLQSVTSFSSAEKSSHRKVSCQDPWDSGNDHRAKWKLSAGT